MSVCGLAQGWGAASCGREKEAGGALRIRAAQNEQKDRGGVMFTRVCAPVHPGRLQRWAGVLVSPVGKGEGRELETSREGSRAVCCCRLQGCVNKWLRDMVTPCSQPQHGRMGDYTLSFPQEGE